jgi:hypothetical protein
VARLKALGPKKDSTVGETHLKSRTNLKLAVGMNHAKAKELIDELIAEGKLLEGEEGYGTFRRKVVDLPPTQTAVQ